MLEILRSLPSRMKSSSLFPSETGETALNANTFINRLWITHSDFNNFAHLAVQDSAQSRTLQLKNGPYTDPYNL